jgi:hypothetical protein
MNKIIYLEIKSSSKTSASVPFGKVILSILDKVGAIEVI